MSFCKNCGSELPSDAVFCPKCGARNENAFSQAGTGGWDAPKGPMRAAIRQRGVATCVILSIVTFGIYGLVWYFNIVSDLDTASPAADDKTPGTVLLLSIVTCGIYGLIWLYRAGEKVDGIKAANGEAPSSSAVLYLILSLVGFSIVAYCLIQSELNKIATIPA